MPWSAVAGTISTGQDDAVCKLISHTLTSPSSSPHLHQSRWTRRTAHHHLDPIENSVSFLAYRRSHAINAPLLEMAPGETTVVADQLSTNANGATTLSGKLAGARLA